MCVILPPFIPAPKGDWFSGGRRIKEKKKKPKSGPGPILAGSPTAGSRVSYNIDLEEHQLGEFLEEKIDSGQIYQSDREILRRHRMDGLFDKQKMSRREASLMNVRKLAEYYKEKGEYPKPTDPDPEVRKLFRWLRGKRYAPDRAIYEGERELGIGLRLPKDWLEPRRFRANLNNRGQQAQATSR